MLFPCVYVFLHKIPLLSSSFNFPYLQSTVLSKFTFMSSFWKTILTMFFLNVKEYSLSWMSPNHLPIILNQVADNTKLGGTIDSLKGGEALQRDLHRVEHWQSPTMWNLRTNARCCTWDDVVLDILIEWVTRVLNTAPEKGTQEFLLVVSSMWVNNLPWWPKWPTL